MLKPSSSILSYSVSGTIAGAFSAFIFAIIHDTIISDIWYSLSTMMIGGAICGFCVAWSYKLLFQKPLIWNWWKYNIVYVILFIILGALSVIVYEPVTTVAELIISNEPPLELIMQAMPMTIAFTVGSSILVSALFSRKILHQLAILLTCIVLVVLLGLNVSLIGLVFFPSDMLYLILEMYGLILAINLVYAVTFMLLQWKSLR